MLPIHPYTLYICYAKQILNYHRSFGKHLDCFEDAGLWRNEDHWDSVTDLVLTRILNKTKFNVLPWVLRNAQQGDGSSALGTFTNHFCYLLPKVMKVTAMPHNIAVRAPLGVRKEEDEVMEKEKYGIGWQETSWHVSSFFRHIFVKITSIVIF